MMHSAAKNKEAAEAATEQEGQGEGGKEGDGKREAEGGDGSKSDG